MYEPGPRFFRTVHPDLRAAARAASHDGIRLQDLAGLAGFTCPQQLSTQLHARRLPKTKLTADRFAKIAELLNYRGDVFLDYPEKQRA